MGVDTSVTIGVGFIIDPEVWAAYVAKVDPDDSMFGEEYFGGLKADTTGLEFGTGGSYYTDGSENRDYIAVRRLTKDYDTHDLPGGVITFKKPVLTLAERLALLAVASEIGQTDPVFTQFVAILWH